MMTYDIDLTSDNELDISAYETSFHVVICRNYKLKKMAWFFTYLYLSAKQSLRKDKTRCKLSKLSRTLSILGCDKIIHLMAKIQYWIHTHISAHIQTLSI